MAVALIVTGCASFGRGVTQGLLQSRVARAEDNRACRVEGVPFQGILPLLEQQAGFGSLDRDDPSRPELKVIYVHGMGTQRPGHGAILLDGLAEALDLSVRSPRTKRVELVARGDPDRELGELNVQRLANPERTRDLLFYEVTWSAINDPAKESLAFDRSNVYRSRRASLNQALREFANNTLPDVLAFAGDMHEPILESVGQALCWAMSRRWSELPRETRETVCRFDAAYGSRVALDDFVIITHSLGSRVAVDALQRAARMIGRPEFENDPQIQRVAELLRDEEFHLYMLSNQLPLLEAGREPQEVTGQAAAFCGTDAPRADERLLKRLHLVAFTDPNDVLSYPVPQSWADRHLESRLCSSITNVTINLVQVSSLLGLGEFANPLNAHLGYDGDERVRGLLARGAGHDDVAPIVEERCEWTEIDPSLMD